MTLCFVEIINIMKQLKILLCQQKKNLRKITAYTLYNDLYKMQNILVSFYHDTSFIQENTQALAQKTRQL